MIKLTIFVMVVGAGLGAISGKESTPTRSAIVGAGIGLVLVAIYAFLASSFAPGEETW